MKRLFTYIATALLTTSLHATTYFASPNGIGDGLSYGSPTKWSNALSALQPGDTLYLLDGQYDFSAKQTIGTGKNGLSASKRTFIGAYPGEEPVFDFRQQPYGSEVTGSNNIGVSISANTLYIHIKGLTIRYAGKNGLINYGSYNVFENLHVYGCGDSGIQMKNGGNNTILNCDSHDNFDYKTMSGNTANFGGNADGFADKQFTGAGNHYIGCRAWNNSDDGWDFFQRASSSNTIIENCICYHNGQPYYNMKDHPRYQVDKAWFDSKVGTQMTDRYGNTITISLEQYPCQGNGNGFKIGGQGTNHKVLVHHCLAVGNYARGFDQNNNGGTMWLYNNTGYDNFVNFGFTTAYGTNTLQNNISFKGQNADSYSSQTNVANDHNSWNKGFSVSTNDFLSLDDAQILAARQADGALSNGTCLHLKAGSALIDAGIDVNLGYNGNAPDLGCYETDGEHHDPTPEDTVPAVQPEGTHAVAFVTIPGAAEDKALLTYLRTNDSLWIVETDANDAETNYTDYEVIVLGSKPSSGAAGFTPLKGYNKPMLLLKPWLLKANVWNWGTAVNTSLLDVHVANPAHPLFNNITLTDGLLPLFSQCNTNAVTGISAWTNTTGFENLGSIGDTTVIADFSAGTNCNGTVLPQRLVMIGVSEYSTAYLTAQGKQLIENAILYLLNITMPQGIESIETKQNTATKYFDNGILYIRVNGRLFDSTGRLLR